MTRRQLLESLSALVPVTALAETAAPPPKPLQILVLTGRDSHDWRGVTPIMRSYLESTGMMDVRIAEEFRDAGPEAFRGYHAAVLVYSDKDESERWSDGTRAALLDFVRSGKGLVVYHHSSTAFKDWPEYAKLCGGNYYGKHGQHSPIHDFTVEFTDRTHPITRGLKPGFLQKEDELYAKMLMQPSDTYHVLATAYDDHALYNGKSKQPIPGPGDQEPLMWVRQEGKGRVFALMIGHSPQAVSSVGFRVVFSRGVEWAATGGVTQPVPAEMAG